MLKRVAVCDACDAETLLLDLGWADIERGVYPATWVRIEPNSNNDVPIAWVCSWACVALFAQARRAAEVAGHDDRAHGGA